MSTSIRVSAIASFASVNGQPPDKTGQRSVVQRPVLVDDPSACSTFLAARNGYTFAVSARDGQKVSSPSEKDTSQIYKVPTPRNTCAVNKLRRARTRVVFFRRETNRGHRCCVPGALARDTKQETLTSRQNAVFSGYVFNKQTVLSVF